MCQYYGTVEVDFSNSSGREYVYSFKKKENYYFTNILFTYTRYVEVKSILNKIIYKFSLICKDRLFKISRHTYRKSR